MKIKFDEQIFIRQRRGGVSKYFSELISTFNFHPENEIQTVTPFRYVKSEHLIEKGPTRFSNSRLPQFAQRRKVFQIMNYPRRISRNGNSDIVHHTYYAPMYLRQPAIARICTIYDMIPEKFPEFFPTGNPHRGKDIYVNACDALLCISNTTKTDVLRHYGNLDKPVIVTPLGVGGQFFNATANLNSDVQFVLFVGRRSEYKNFGVLLRAFAKLDNRHHKVKLICVGGGQFSDLENTQIEILGLHGRIFQKSALDHEIPQFYASAICMVFPSIYEGFGLPIVEAFASGCPVVLAETEPSVETGANAAQYFTADDDDALAGTIARLIDDSVIREYWIAEGRLRALDFKWEKTAKLTSDAYREVARKLLKSNR